MEHYSFNDLPQAIQEVTLRLGRVENLLQDKQYQSQPKIHKIYTLPEAALYCRMPIPTFRTHLAKRNVSGSKPGKRWVFRQEDLDKFLQKFHMQTKDEIDKAIRSKNKKA